MQADDIAAYFTKKLAKPIAFDIEGAEQDGEQVHFYYSIEPTAVDNDVLHVIVNYKHAMPATIDCDHLLRLIATTVYD